MKVQTIDIQAKEWFDRVNGNSYFSAQIFVNYGLKSQKQFKISFQYGYGDQYIYTSLALLKKEGLITTTTTHELRSQGIILRNSLKENCLKKDVKEFGI